MDMKVSRMVTVIVTILRSRSALGVGCPLGKGVGNLPMVIVFVVGCGFEPARVQRNAFVVVVIVVTLIDIIQLMFVGKTDSYIPVRENQQVTQKVHKCKKGTQYLILPMIMTGMVSDL